MKQRTYWYKIRGGFTGTFGWQTTKEPQEIVDELRKIYGDKLLKVWTEIPVPNSMFKGKKMIEYHMCSDRSIYSKFEIVDDK